MNDLVTKGSCVFYNGEWFVVVKSSREHLSCICDHSNNTHHIRNKDAELIVSAKEIILAHNWRISDNEHLDLALSKRTCPYEVIAEVLAGVHDDRF